MIVRVQLYRKGRDVKREEQTQRHSAAKTDAAIGRRVAVSPYRRVCYGTTLTESTTINALSRMLAVPRTTFSPSLIIN